MKSPLYRHWGFWLILILSAVLLAGLFLFNIRDTQFGWLRDISLADKVSVDRTMGKPSEEEIEKFYTKRGQPIVVSAAAADQLKKLVRKALTMDGPRKACVATPGFVLTFVRGNQEYNVFVCYECYSFGVYRAKEHLIGVDFDEVAPELTRILQPLFPDAFK